MCVPIHGGQQCFHCLKPCRNSSALRVDFCNSLHFPKGEMHPCCHVKISHVYFKIVYIYSSGPITGTKILKKNVQKTA